VTGSLASTGACAATRWRGVRDLRLVRVFPCRDTAARAGCLAGAGPGQHMYRLARRGHTLDGQVGQVRKQDGESLKIARPP
jgi:hypothetical protein